MYRILRTDTADSGIRSIVLYIAENFGRETALEKLNELEKSIGRLAEEPYLGMEPKYMVLRRQEFRVLTTEKDLIFYKVSEETKTVTIYAVSDQRQDYLKILNGM